MESLGMKNNFFILVLIVLVGGLLYLLAPILTPFLAGALLAYLGDPLVKQLQRLHLPRFLCVIIVFLLLFSLIGLLIVLLIPLIQKQLITLTVVIPNTIAWLQNTILPWLS